MKGIVQTPNTTNRRIVKCDIRFWENSWLLLEDENIVLERENVVTFVIEIKKKRCEITVFQKYILLNIE